MISFNKCVYIFVFHIPIVNLYRPYFIGDYGFKNKLDMALLKYIR